MKVELNFLFHVHSLSFMLLHKAGKNWRKETAIWFTDLEVSVHRCLTLLLLARTEAKHRQQSKSYFKAARKWKEERVLWWDRASEIKLQSPHPLIRLRLPLFPRLHWSAFDSGPISVLVIRTESSFVHPFLNTPPLNMALRTKPSIHVTLLPR